MQMTNFDQAIQRQQIEAHYQPIVDMNSGVIVAIEARVRWNAGIGQLFTAADVLQAAADAEANWPLDQVMLELAVESTGRLAAEAGPALRIAVNISAATCTSEIPAAALEALLERTGIKPQGLRLEFPCVALSESPGTVVPLLKRLSIKGYYIVIDHLTSADFMSAHFDDAGVQAVKLHENLVMQTPGDNESTNRVRDICRAATERGLQVGGEGVVRLEQLECLRQAGCQEGQGPLISRPYTLDRLMFLLKKGRCW